MPNLHGDHLDWLRGRLSVLLVVGQGAWETHPTGSLPPVRMAEYFRRRASGASDLWGYDVSHDWEVVAATTRPPPATLLLSPIASWQGGDMSIKHHLVGLLLGAEEDWPTAFEMIVQRLGAFSYAGDDHVLDTERVRIHPFNLRDDVRHQVVIDRLAYWYYHPREWLKKAALNDLYLLNSLHLPVDGEARGVLRDDAARPAHPRHRAGALQAPGGQRALGVHRAQLQRFLRPASARPRNGIPAVHEAVRRRRLAWRVPDQGRGRAAAGLRRFGRDADAPAEVSGAVRRLRPGSDHRAGVHGHAFPAGRADARPVRGGS